MKFLTRAWHAGDLSDEATEVMEHEYRAFRARILPLLPAQARAFAEAVSIHDATLRSVFVNHPARTLELRLRAGDLQRGYFDLDLSYSDASLTSADTAALSRVARNVNAEALYDELDVDASHERYEHRWLWWPYEEFTVRFSKLTYAILPQAVWEFSRASDPYVEIGSPAG